MKETEAKIKKILVNKLQVASASLNDCSLQTPLLGRGLGLDSIAAMSLASGIEEEFDIQIDDDDLTEELFANLASLIYYVECKLARGRQ